MDSEIVQWRNLPKDLLVMVAASLGTGTDILRLRAVCSPWRSSLSDLSRNNNSPLFSVKFPSPVPLNPNLRGYFTLTVSTIYYLEPFGYENPNGSSASAEGWMVKVEEAKSGKIRVLDTLAKFQWARTSRRRISSMELNLLNVRVFEVKKVCNLQFINVGNDCDNLKSDVFKKVLLSLWDEDCDNLKSAVKKVVMSSIPLWDEDNIADCDCAILTINRNGKLAYFKFGDNQWTMIDDGQGESYYDDILHHNDRFYAVDSKGKMIVIDSSLNVSVIESPVHRDGIRDGEYKYKSLVESNGDLYLLDKPNGFKCSSEFKLLFDKHNDLECSSEFKVYKLNGEEKEWVQVSSLGDQAFFIGDDCSFAVSARQFSGCEGNCIYFPDNEFMVEDRDGYPGYNVGVFDLEKESSDRLSYFKGYSQIFWPPPTWLNLNASSKPSSSRCRR